MHIYKVLECYPPLHPPQLLPNPSSNAPFTFMFSSYFSHHTHLVNAISVYMGPSMHTGCQPMALCPKKMTIHSGHSWLPIALQLVTEILNILECWLVWSCAENHSCAFMSAPFRACPEDSIAQDSPPSSSSQSVYQLFSKAMSLEVGFDIGAPCNCFWTMLLTVLTIITTREITIASLRTSRMPILFNPFYYSIAKVSKIFTDQPTCPLPVPGLSHLMI